MVYQEKFVAVVKSNNKILREKENNTVYLPFGSEYEILLKNLESRIAVVSITIDGQDVLNGYQLVVDPNSNKTLEGFLDRSGTRVTNKFKFIHKTEQIIEHRGDNIDDGMIRVEYRFQNKKPIKETIIKEQVYNPPHSPFCTCPQCRPDYHWPKKFSEYTDSGFYGSSCRGMSGTSGCSTNPERISKGIQLSSCINNSLQSSDSFSSAMTPVMDSIITNHNISADEGLTVKGSNSNQTFKRVYLNDLEENSHVIVINIKGAISPIGVEPKKILEPITVEKSLICSTCGKKHKSNKNFCDNCGTALF